MLAILRSAARPSIFCKALATSPYPMRLKETQKFGDIALTTFPLDSETSHTTYFPVTDKETPESIHERICSHFVLASENDRLLMKASLSHSMREDQIEIIDTVFNRVLGIEIFFRREKTYFHDLKYPKISPPKDCGLALTHLSPTNSHPFFPFGDSMLRIEPFYSIFLASSFQQLSLFSTPLQSGVQLTRVPNIHIETSYQKENYKRTYILAQEKF